MKKGRGCEHAGRSNSFFPSQAAAALGDGQSITDRETTTSQTRDISLKRVQCPFTETSGRLHSFCVKSTKNGNDR